MIAPESMCCCFFFIDIVDEILHKSLKSLYKYFLTINHILIQNNLFVFTRFRVVFIWSIFSMCMVPVWRYYLWYLLKRLVYFGFMVLIIFPPMLNRWLANGPVYFGVYAGCTFHRHFYWWYLSFHCLAMKTCLAKNIFIPNGVSLLAGFLHYHQFFAYQYILYIKFWSHPELLNRYACLSMFAFSEIVFILLLLFCYYWKLFLQIEFTASDNFIQTGTGKTSCNPWSGFERRNFSVTLQSGYEKFAWNWIRRKMWIEQQHQNQ